MLIVFKRNKLFVKYAEKDLWSATAVHFKPTFHMKYINDFPKHINRVESVLYVNDANVITHIVVQVDSN